MIDLVLRGAFARVAVGLMLGLPLAVGAGRLIAAQLYGVAVLGSARAGDRRPARSALCAFFAALIPAGRAASMSPITALRTD